MAAQSRLYLDPEAPVDRRVDDLLERMTLEEKIGQLVGTVTNGLDDVREKIDDHHLGLASPFAHGGEENNTPEEAARLANELQRYATERTRLGVPLLFYVDADHGHARINGATVLPHNLGMAATRDPELQERAASVTAREIRATGAHQNLNPVTDVGREPRWGRVYETYGESPRLCAVMSAAKVRGYQEPSLDDEGSVVATPKHFPAYGEPNRGEDASYVDVSEYTVRRTFLPPFEAVIDAGARSIMPCYNALEGEPVHGSYRYLTGLLRGELGFDGYSVSDWGGVHMLHEDHRTAESFAEAVRQATTAGLDVASVAGPEYADRLRSFVESGELSEARIEASARRVLRTKFELGLFENPFVDVDDAVETLGRDEHREVAREAARRSVTLLKNEDGVLPLDDPDSVLLAGPNADSVPHQFGGWSAISDPEPPAVTLRDGLESALPDGTRVDYEPGCEIDGELAESRNRAAALAAEADVAVVALGENNYVHEFGERFGEWNASQFPNRHAFGLPEAQLDLVRAIRETGTPTVAVLVGGRPLPIPELVETVPGILWAYYPGTEGGRAVADVLTGEVNPSGTLPISIPRSAGHLPTRFNYYPHPRPVGLEGEEGGSHLDSYDPLFPFGFGLSYTSFELDSLDLSAEQVGPRGTVDVRVGVENVGDRAGEKAVDVFVDDRYSRRITPVRQLVGFDRVSLDPGERKTVEVTVDVTDFAPPSDDRPPAAEPGEVDVVVGSLRETFRVDSAFE